MIYYFSGTGNSEWIAKKLLEIDDDESLGLVFPVYAWGVPSQVKKGIIELGKSEQFELQTDTLMGLGKKVSTGSPYVYAVMTCGDDMGYTDKELSGLLSKYCGLKLSAVFSVHMPNTYVCLPGFDVDSDDIAATKIENTLARLPQIMSYIAERKETTDVHRGVFPLTKSYVLRPFFNKFLIMDKYFRVAKDRCTSCGLCVKACPKHNISLAGNVKRPVWKGDCCGCLGCYHVCPKHAIEWGKYTKGKGQKKRLKDE